MGEQTIEADVAVVGGGNAALCAALVARESGVSVTVLESAPVEYRGGNSRHTRNMRCMHETPTNVLTDAYTEEEYFSDLLRVTEGNTAQDLARLMGALNTHAPVKWIGPVYRLGAKERRGSMVCPLPKSRTSVTASRTR